MGVAAAVKARMATTAAWVRRMMSVGAGVVKRLKGYMSEGLKSDQCCSDRLREIDKLVSCDVKLVKVISLLFIHEQRFEPSVVCYPSEHLPARSPVRSHLATRCHPLGPL